MRLTLISMSGVVKNLQFRSAEDALETLRLATESASIGVWDWNLLTGKVRCSDLTRKIFTGYDLEADPYVIFREALDPKDLDSVMNAWLQAMQPESKGNYDIEYRICHPDGQTSYVHARGKVFFEEHNGVQQPVRFIGTVHDLTEKKLAAAALMQAEQLAMTGRLAASIAHEINNPLEAVTNLLYLLRGRQNDREAEDYLALAESELARVGQIVSQTLRFHRDPAGVVAVNCTDLLRSVLTLFQGKIQQTGIDAQVELKQQRLIHAHQGEMRQVLVNLIGNAIDAMPNGGRLRIRCRDFFGRRVDQPAGVGVCIADTGIGMKPEVMQRVFEPFYTTKGSAGTGLGLWISHSIVKKHGFKLRVKSQPGTGTVFSIFMPCAGSEAISKTR